MRRFILILKNNCRLIFLALLLLMYIYEFTFSTYGFPTYVTSRRVAVIVAICYLVVVHNRKKYVSKNLLQSLKVFFQINILLLMYSSLLIFIIGAGTGSHITIFIIQMILFGILPVYLFANIFNCIEELASALLIVGVVQAVVTIVGLVNVDFGNYIYDTFVIAGAPDHRLNGYVGGIACITAPGFFHFSLSLIACLYFVLNRKAFIYIPLYLLLSFVGVMYARTGLVISIGGLFFIYYVKSEVNDKKSLIGLTSILFGFILIGIYLFQMLNFDEIFDFKRLQNLFEDGPFASFFDGYYHGETTKIPPLSLEMFMGIGITSGISSSGIQINADGGFVRLYSAWGIIFSVLFYYYFFKSLYMINKRNIENRLARLLIYFFIFVILMAEYKEFMIYEQCLVCMFYLFVILENRSEKYNCSVTTSSIVNDK